MSVLNGVKPPVEFGERTRDCSLSHAGNKGPYLTMTGESCGFLEQRRQCGISHEVRRLAQGSSPGAPGMSGLHARVEGEGVIALEIGRAHV